MRGGSAELAALHARGEAVDFGFVAAFEHFLQLGEQVAPSADALPLADFPLALLAFEDVLGDQRGVGEGRLARGFCALLVGFEGAGEGFIGVVDSELCLRYS